MKKLLSTFKNSNFSLASFSWFTSCFVMVIRLKKMMLGIVMTVFVLLILVECRISTDTQAERFGYYFGITHGHSNASDGQGTPAEAYVYTRDIAKLDFFVLTDHWPWTDAQEWEDIKNQADLANKEGSFVALYGFEWTTGYITKERVGHINVFGTEYLPDSACVWLKDLYAWLAAENAFAIFNHPMDDLRNFYGFEYDNMGDSVIKGIEMWRLDSEPDVNVGAPKGREASYIAALNKGWHIGVFESDDSHKAQWGTTNGRWTVAVAPELTRQSILDALRSSHTYMTRDRNCKLLFTGNGKLMGETIDVGSTQIKLSINIEDPDTNDVIQEVALFHNGLVEKSIVPMSNTYTAEFTYPVTPGPNYYFIRVIQKDGDVMWSSPVFVDGVANLSS